MSRVANNPVSLPDGVELQLAPGGLSVKGKGGQLQMALPSNIEVRLEDGVATVQRKKGATTALAGTVRALLSNLVAGVSEGFERKLELVGVGYRAQAQGKRLNLTLGFSHPVNFPVPEGITIETPTQTEILVKGPDKQQVGQVAAEIRALRPPEPYKGKGVRYAAERVHRKEAKKK